MDKTTDATASKTAADNRRYRVQEIENVTIRVRDSTLLSGRLWLPVVDADVPDKTHRGSKKHMQRSFSMSSTPVDESRLLGSSIQFPGILEMIPYGKRHGTSHRDEEQYSYIAHFGFACLRVDCRGTGESEGVLEDEYLPSEHMDAVDCIAWMRQQPWCTGKIGMTGISWGGFNAMQVAMLRPPGLEGIIALCCSENRYAQDVHYAGGCLLTDNIAWSGFMTAMLATPPDPALMAADKAELMWRKRLETTEPWLTKWLQHQWYDDYWKQGSLCEDWSAIGCSVLVASGWADGYRDMVPAVLENIKLPAGKLARGINGPWAHNLPHAAAPGPNIDWLADVVSWWQYCLQDNPEKEAEWRRRPAYTAYMQEFEEPNIVVAYRPGRWVGEQQWPSKRIVDWPLFLNRDHSLSSQPHTMEANDSPLLRVPGVNNSPQLTVDATEEQTAPIANICSPLATGLDCGRLGYGQDPDFPLDQRNVDANSLCFETAALASDLSVLGRPKVVLHLSTADPLSQIHVRLCDVCPRTGQSVLVTAGVLNLTHRESHTKQDVSASLPPVMRVELTLSETGHVFPAGNRLRLGVSTSLWPLVWPSPRKVNLGVHTHDGVSPESLSRLILPVRPIDGGIGDLMGETCASASYPSSTASSSATSSADSLPGVELNSTLAAEAEATPTVNSESTPAKNSDPLLVVEADFNPAVEATPSRTGLKTPTTKVTSVSTPLSRMTRDAGSHRRSQSLMVAAVAGGINEHPSPAANKDDDDPLMMLKTLSPSLFRRPRTATPHPRHTLRETTMGTRNLQTDYVSGDTTLYLTKDYGHYRDEHTGIERGDWTEEVFGVCDPKHRWGVEGKLGQTAWMEVKYGIELARSAEWFRKLWQQGRVVGAVDQPHCNSGWRVVVESKTRMHCTESHFHTETRLCAWRYASYDGRREVVDDPLKQNFMSDGGEVTADRKLIFSRDWSHSVPRDGM